MSVTEISPTNAPATASKVATPWMLRRARWFLLIMHIPVVGIAWSDAVFLNTGGAALHPVVITALTLALLGVQFRHSLAASRGQRPRGWLLTALLLLGLAYIPMFWLTWNWQPDECVIVASALMLLRGRIAVVIAAIPVLVTGIWVTIANLSYGTPTAIGEFFYFVVTMLIAGLGLYGAARLILVLEELQTNRTELAGLAVVQERLRVSRDLHDLLGQSLSAISLKGDLALRLLRRDPPAARTEIESLTGMARDALRDIRYVARDQLAVSLPTETQGAAAVLSAAGIDAEIEVDLPGLAPPLERVFAWAVREGVTNVLRHSQAQVCSITATRTETAVTLTMINDGARPKENESGGAGLAGLAERARALSGTLSAGHTPDGRFRLVVRFPQEAT